MTQPALIQTADSVLMARPRRTKPKHPFAHLVTQKGNGVTGQWCRTCKAPILAGLDNEACAFPAKVDITPLTPAGEMVAQVSGRRTYELRRIHSRVARLYRRTAALIREHPAGAPGALAIAYDVLPEHVCRQPIAEALTTTSAIQPTTATDAVTSCPF